MLGPQDVDVVVKQYSSEFRPTRIEPQGAAGGFSGSELWRLTTPVGALALKCWPPDYPSPKLSTVQSLLRHVCRQGITLVPVPIAARNGETHCQHRHRLWDLTPWMPGTANYRQKPSRGKLASAMQVLASFHLAAASYPGSTACGPSAGLTERSTLLAELRAGGHQTIRKSLPSVDWPEARVLAQSIQERFGAVGDSCQAMLRAAEGFATPLQYCIRDIWHDHVLYEGERVSGLVDFGALRIDSVATDVARLIGSLVRDDEAAWKFGLDAYSEVRPLSSGERMLVAAFDRSSVALTGMNWLTWIFVEQRRFADRGAVLGRLRETLSRLEHLTEKEP